MRLKSIFACLLLVRWRQHPRQPGCIRKHETSEKNLSLDNKANLSGKSGQVRVPNLVIRHITAEVHPAGILLNNRSCVPDTQKAEDKHMPDFYFYRTFSRLLFPLWPIYV